MTENDAWVLINAQKGEDDPKEFLEDCLFEIKQFLLSKPFISKLVGSQIKKLNRLNQVVQVLEIDINNNVIPDNRLDTIDLNDSILSTFNTFELSKSQLKKDLVASASPTDIILIIAEMLNLQECYSNCWPFIEIEVEEGIVISKEPDAMEMLDEIKKITNAGVVAFQQLTQISLVNYPNVANELKRLSLLRKKEIEWKMSLKN